MTLFETETIADLMWQQGHGDEAIALCGRLASRAREPERQRLLAKVERWQRDLTGRPARAASHPPAPQKPGGTPRGTERSALRPRDPAGAAPRIDRRDGGDGADVGTAAVTLTQTASGLALAWSLPPAEAGRAVTPPSAELFLVRRTPAGLDVQRRTLPLGAMQGSLDLPVAELHSARAAVGFLETNGFRPLARSSLLQAPAPPADPSSST